MGGRELDDWIESYLRYAENTEPPEIYHRWVAVSLIAAALRRKCWLRHGVLYVYPNLYVALVGPPGKARKSTAMAMGRTFLDRIGVPLASESITREALVRELASSTESVKLPDGTVLLHSSLTIYSSEFAVFLGQNNPQLLYDLADWYDCRDRWVYRTKHEGTDEIIGVWVNILGATTTDLLEDLLPATVVTGGLTSRIIFVYAERKGKTVVEPTLTDEQVELEGQLLRDLRRIAALVGPFRVDESWRRLWAEWYPAQEEEVETGGDPRLDSYVSRRPFHAIKLSMIMAASRGSSGLVTAEDLRRAIDLLKRTETTMALAFGTAGRSGVGWLVQRLRYVLRQEGITTFSELMRRFVFDADKRTMTQAIETLVAMGEVALKHDGGEIYVRWKKQRAQASGGTSGPWKGVGGRPSGGGGSGS